MKTKLTYTPAELEALNALWEVELSRNASTLQKLVYLVVAELASEFRARACKPQDKYRFTLKAYQALALREYLGEVMLKPWLLDQLGAYEKKVVQTEYMRLDRLIVTDTVSPSQLIH